MTTQSVALSSYETKVQEEFAKLDNASTVLLTIMTYGQTREEKVRMIALFCKELGLLRP